MGVSHVTQGGSSGNQLKASYMSTVHLQRTMQSSLGGVEDGFGPGLAGQKHLDQDQKLNWTWSPPLCL